MSKTYILLQTQLDNRRPSTLSSGQKRYVVLLVESEKVVTAAEARNYTEGSEIASVTSNTIRRQLKRSSLNARVI